MMADMGWTTPDITGVDLEMLYPARVGPPRVMTWAGRPQRSWGSIWKCAAPRGWCPHGSTRPLAGRPHGTGGRSGNAPSLIRGSPISEGVDEATQVRSEHNLDGRLALLRRTAGGDQTLSRAENPGPVGCVSGCRQIAVVAGCLDGFAPVPIVVGRGPGFPPFRFVIN